ncbi:MAG: AMP-binding protein [Actinomycetota bacterium]|nr:AMP-binding protein [Actinomycetota bacterium]
MRPGSRLERRLLDWLDQPDPQRGVHFASDDGTWEFVAYDRLAGDVREAAAGLEQMGVGAGDVVMTVLPGSARFIASFFGTLLRGAIPSPVAPRTAYEDRTTYLRHLEGVLMSGSPRMVVTDPENAGEIVAIAATAAATGPRAIPVVSSEAVAAEGRRASGVMASSSPRPPDRSPSNPNVEGTDPVRDPARIALLQFTSGSSSLAKGVAVPASALEANINAIARWLGFSPGLPVASWLPVHHDMGLVGCLLAPICCGSDLWSMSPTAFIADPGRYVQCFSEHGAAFSAMPSFGLGYLLRRARMDDCSGLDLSSVQGIVLGAERTDPRLLQRAQAALGAIGLRPGALLPAYGLAESTLAVTGVRPGDPLGTIRLNAGGTKVIERRSDPLDTSGILTCGRALSGTIVRVVSESGEELPDGTVGEVVVEGASVAAGYWHDGNPLSSTRFEEGRLFTGDAGVLVDEELYLIGRMGDALKVRGRPVFAEDLELALVHAGLQPHKVVVTLGLVDTTPTVLVLLEEEREAAVALAHDTIRRLAPTTSVLVRRLPAGSFVRTSSGKPRRRVLWDHYV